jgi:hypothetical protein
MSDYRYAYVTDLETPHNSRRVLSIARKFNEDGTMTYGTSMNKPTTWREINGRNRCVFVRIPGDAFSRAVGRKLAVARAECERTAVTIVVPKGMHPYIAVLHDIARNADHTMASIARSEVAYREFQETWGIEEDLDECSDCTNCSACTG